MHVAKEVTKYYKICFINKYPTWLPFDYIHVRTLITSIYSSSTIHLSVLSVSYIFSVYIIYLVSLALHPHMGGGGIDVQFEAPKITRTNNKHKLLKINEMGW